MWLLMSGGGAGIVGVGGGTGESSGYFIGNIVGVGTGICYAVFVICLRLQKTGSAYETVFLGNIFTFLIGLPFFFIAPPEPLDLLPVVFLGVFQIAVPYLLLTYASKHAKAIDISLLTILEPLLNPVWVFIVTGENPGVKAIIGGVILLGVVVLKSAAALRYEKSDTANSSKP